MDSPSSTLSMSVQEAPKTSSGNCSHRYSPQANPFYCNAQMTPRLMKQFAQPRPQDMEMLREAMNRLQHSARAYDRILRVARTIADLDGSPDIQAIHLTEAISFRSLDRAGWGE